MAHLASIYLDTCLSKGSLFPNPHILAVLETTKQSVEELNLSGQATARDLPHLVPIVTRCRRLRRLILRESNLGDDAIRHLVLVILQHPSLEEVDLSCNPLTIQGGRLLLQLARGNPRIRRIHVDETAIRNCMEKDIERQLQLNGMPDQLHVLRPMQASITTFEGGGRSEGDNDDEPAISTQAKHLNLQNSIGPKGFVLSIQIPNYHTLMPSHTPNHPPAKMGTNLELSSCFTRLFSVMLHMTGLVWLLNSYPRLSK